VDSLVQTHNVKICHTFSPEFKATLLPNSFLHSFRCSSCTLIRRVTICSNKRVKGGYTATDITAHSLCLSLDKIHLLNTHQYYIRSIVVSSPLVIQHPILHL